MRASVRTPCRKRFRTRGSTGCSRSGRTSGGSRTMRYAGLIAIAAAGAVTFVACENMRPLEDRGGGGFEVTSGAVATGMTSSSSASSGAAGGGGHGGGGATSSSSGKGGSGGAGGAGGKGGGAMGGNGGAGGMPGDAGGG